ncbi:hypothetical protein OUZ56_011837 [Daphnia magna]|uniref:Uncharacterized protein n=1 Tax=Daphnia magna TaxID=35525 RepID=A0ABQ9Z194_9CRUS|nr:hypothetical protein OUZ56_011837 [Daphnia magna]
MEGLVSTVSRQGLLSNPSKLDHRLPPQRSFHAIQRPRLSTDQRRKLSEVPVHFLCFFIVLLSCWNIIILGIFLGGVRERLLLCVFRSVLVIHCRVCLPKLLPPAGAVLLLLRLVLSGFLHC